MANLKLKDSDGNVKEVKASGAGTTGDPFIMERSLAAGETHIGEVGGKLAIASHTFSRPSDTTAYAVGDGVTDSTSAPTIMTFSNLGRQSNATGYIVKAKMFSSLSTFTARLRFHLFNTNAITIPNDNAAYVLTYANRVIYQGYIDFPAAQKTGGGTGSFAMATGINLAFLCTGGVSTMYGILETLDIFTPSSAQAFMVELMANQN